MKQLAAFIQRDILTCGGRMSSTRPAHGGAGDAADPAAIRPERGRHPGTQDVRGHRRQDLALACRRAGLAQPHGGEGSPANLVYRTAVTPLTWFEIPYRCSVPNGVQGLLVGRRTLSQTH